MVSQILTTHVILNIESGIKAVIALDLGGKDLTQRFDSKYRHSLPHILPSCASDPSGLPGLYNYINILVIRVMNNKFDQNWARKFRENVENMNFPYNTVYDYVNFDPKNGSFRCVQLL